MEEKMVHGWKWEEEESWVFLLFSAHFIDFKWVKDMCHNMIGHWGFNDIIMMSKFSFISFFFFSFLLIFNSIFSNIYSHFMS